MIARFEGTTANFYASGRRARGGVRTRALTLVETMMAMSALSLLTAMLIPAVQMARESSRRSQCLNNLREMLHGCAAHESARREFPYTAIEYSGRDRQRHAPRSPHEGLLPYLEQGPIYAQIDFDDFPLDVSTMPPSSAANGALLSQSVPVFQCPTDYRLPGGNNYRACMGFGPGIFTTAETKICTDPGNGTGAFVNGRAIAPAEFLDGLSATVMFSERVMGSRGAYRPYSDYLVSSPNICTAADAVTICSSLAAGGAHDAYGGSTWLLGGWRQTWYNHILTPNSPVPDCNANPISAGGGRGIYTARSFHPGGVNSGMADGSVRFIADTIDVSIWRAVSSRRGGEAQDL